MINPHLPSDEGLESRLDLYRFFGKVIGMAIRSNIPLPLDLPSTFWKPLVGDTITYSDIEGVDFSTAKLLVELEEISEQDFESKYGVEDKRLSFTVFTSKDEIHELIPGGKNIYITWSNRFDYIQRVKDFKIKEDQLQMKSIKEGLSSIIPADALMLFTWQELELSVCGYPYIDIAILRENAVYEDVDSGEEHISHFWQVLEEFDSDQRSKFLQFVWARTRLPSSGLLMNFKIQKSRKEDPDKYLPTTQTCFFSISLPTYSSLEVTRKHLLYAITHCVDMDNDILLH